MRTRFAGFVAVVMCAAAVSGGPLLAQAGRKADQAGVAGNWTLNVKGGPHGDTTMGFSLKQDGTKVTGMFASPHGEVPLTGEFADTALELATVPRNADDPQVTFKAKLKDDGTLTGYLSSQMGDMTFTAQRAKDK